MNVMTVTEVVAAEPQTPVKNDQQGDAQVFASELSRASSPGQADCNNSAKEAPRASEADQPGDRPDGAHNQKHKEKGQTNAARFLRGAIPVIQQVQPETAGQTGQTDAAIPSAQTQAAAMQDGMTALVAQAAQNGMVAQSAVQNVMTVQNGTAMQAGVEGTAVQNAAAVQAGMAADAQQTAAQTVPTGTGQTQTPFTGLTETVAMQTATEGSAQAPTQPEATQVPDKAQAFSQQAMHEIEELAKAQAQTNKQPASAPAEAQSGQVQQDSVDIRTRVMQRMQTEQAVGQTDEHHALEAGTIKMAGDDAQSAKKENTASSQTQDASGATVQTPTWSGASGTTAAVPFTAPQPEQPVQQTVATTIVDNISTAVEKDKTELVVQLKPEHLGGLEISLTMGDSGLTAKMVTSQENVQNMIHNQIGLLQDTLREKGIPVVHMEVVYDQTQNSANFSHNSQNSQSGHWTAQGGNGSGQGYKETDDQVNYYNHMSSYDVLAEHGGSVEFSA